MKNTHSNARGEAGFTMVEILVALVIGLVLTAGTIQIFASSRAAYQTTDALARVQEDGRYALQFLSRDIRGAGFIGCSNDVEITNITATPDFTGDLVEGTDGGAGSDIVTIRMAQNQNLQLTSAMSATTDNISLDDTTGLAPGDELIITDCGTADVFSVTNVNPGDIAYDSSTGEFAKAYDASARLYGAVERTYQINGGALQRTENGVAQTLVDNVQNLQVVYGVDLDNDRNADTYLDGSGIVATDPANGPGVIEWGDVVAARVSVTVVSALTNVAADGGSIQHTFSRTISLRNRLE